MQHNTRLSADLLGDEFVLRRVLLVETLWVLLAQEVKLVTEGHHQQCVVHRAGAEQLRQHNSRDDDVVDVSRQKICGMDRPERNGSLTGRK